jgi:hypothetical protein
LIASTQYQGRRLPKILSNVTNGKLKIIRRKKNLPQDNAAILANNDRVQCIFSQEGLKEHRPHHPKDQPGAKNESNSITTDFYFLFLKRPIF